MASFSELNKKPTDNASAYTLREAAALAWPPFLVAALIYAGISAAIIIVACHLANGHFIYPLDDIYIEMAIAKNVAMHGVWGVSPYEFSSSSSSPLFICLLSIVYKIFGVSEYAPLFLSWIFGLASIYMASIMLAEHLTKSWNTIVLVSIVVWTPLFAVGLLGMEHALHLLLTLLFLWLFTKSDEPVWMIAIVTSLMVATRYEGFFLALVGSFLLIGMRRFGRASTIIAAACLPIGLYAAFSIHHGGYWLPNSVAIKGIQVHGLGLTARLRELLGVTLFNSVTAIHLSFLLVGLAVAAISLRRYDRRSTTLLTLVAGAGLLHLMSASVGAVFRYEDYLVASGIIVGALSFPRLRLYNRRVAEALCVFFFFSAGAQLTVRSSEAAFDLPVYSHEIYLQQWQMAKFLNAYYPGIAVAANDIGIINFKNDLHCLDLVGLGSADVFAAKRNGKYSTSFIEQEASRQGVHLAIVYDGWFSSAPGTFGGPPLPSAWLRVRRWTRPRKEFNISGGETLSFYALRPEEADQLRTNLQKFEKTLPPGVSVSP